MSNQDAFGQILAELGPCDDAIAAIQQTAERSWSIQFLDGLAIEIHHKPEDTKLTFASSLGALADLRPSKATTSGSHTSTSLLE